MSLRNNITFTTVLSECYPNNSPERFLVDIKVYAQLPSTLTTTHFDKKENYIAFVTFCDSYTRCNVSWNIKSKDPNDFDSDYYYKEQYEGPIIDLAIDTFKKRFAYQSEKTWK